MKKPRITRKPMIVIRSAWGRWVGNLGAVHAGRPARPVGASTNTGSFAADLLQVQPSATIDSIHDCGSFVNPADRIG
jgi:hypothetical protein